MASQIHFRSISLPSRLHPINTTEFEAEVEKLNPFLLFNHFSLTPPTPAGIDDDSVNVSKAKGDQIAENQIPISECKIEYENQIPISEYKIEYERKVLPPELHTKNVVLLTCDSAAPGGICDVYLVGTAHYSSKSERQVGDVIKFLQPQIVFLELCYQRRVDEAKDTGEFAVAFKLARKYGAKVIYGDRLLHVTYFPCCY